MQKIETRVFDREDTFFGVCQALGEDLGFHPNLLRIALGVLLFWNPVAVLAGYVAAGVVVALTRWLVPNPRMPAEPDQTAAEAPASAESAEVQQPLPLAA